MPAITSAFSKEENDSRFDEALGYLAFLTDVYSNLIITGDFNSDPLRDHDISQVRNFLKNLFV